MNRTQLLITSVHSSDEAAFDNQSSSVIKLNNSTVLYLREVNKFLSLVCILREDNFSRQGVIDYNVLCFREAISQVFELRSQALSKIMETSCGDGTNEDEDDEDCDPGDEDDDDGGDEDEIDCGKSQTTAETTATVASTSDRASVAAATRPENGRAKVLGGVVELGDSGPVLA